MAILKCGYCGGNLDLNEKMTVGVCQFCGSTNTIPNNFEKKQNLYNKATYLRQNKEFDKAIETYDKLLDEDNMDADAHWGLVLSKYGIEYVIDPHSSERIPTCHRILPELIKNDLNYRAALQYAKEISAREVYEREAERIAEIQKKYLEIAKNEDKYDIFICYKETEDTTNQRTLDSTLAQDIYYELEKNGYKVFFARKTLESKLGTEYEPVIFAALNSAKVMIIVGTKPEYYNSVWVRNEWSRYLQFAKKGDKTIIPTYRNMSPYDLPEELAVYQALDMSKIGFLQDLLDSVKRLLNGGTSSYQRYQYQGGINLDALLSRGKMAIEDGLWEDAKKYFEQVLNIDAENIEAYLGLTLAEQKCITIEDIANVHLKKTADATFQKLIVPIKDDTTIEKAISYYSVKGFYGEEDIKKRFDFDLSYQSLVPDRKKQLQNEIKFWDSNILLKKLYRFGDESIKSRLNITKQKIIDVMKQRISEAEFNDQENITNITNAYERHLQEAGQKVIHDHNVGSERAEKAREIQLKKLYEDAMKEYEALNKNNVQKVIKDLTEIKNFYENAHYISEPADLKLDKHIQKCHRKIKIWKRKPFIIFFIIIVMCLIVWAALNTQYNRAITLIHNGEYEKANAILEGISFYKDSSSLIRNNYILISDNESEVSYTEAKELLEAGDYNAAAEIIYYMQNYKDCDVLIDQYNLENTNRFLYENALSLYQSSDYIAAMEKFAFLGDYEDSELYANRCAHDYLFGTWVNEESARYVKITNGYSWNRKPSGTVIYYGGTEIFSGSPSSYEPKGYEFGYDDNDQFAFNIKAENSDNDEVVFGIRNISEESFILNGNGKFSRTDKDYS